MKKKMLLTAVSGVCLFAVTACSGGAETDEQTAPKQQQHEENHKQDKTNKQQTNEDQSSQQTNEEPKKQPPKPWKQPLPEKASAIPVVSEPNDSLVLVNKRHRLPEGYIPKNLVYADVRFYFEEMKEKRKMRKIAADALKQLFAGAKQDGITLFAQSGYRSYNRQQVIFSGNVETMGREEARKVSALPGTSEHQTGLAMDVTSSAVGYKLIQAFGTTSAGLWVEAHGHEYGFIIRYPKGKSDITGYSYEPWHLRYVGKEAATYIYKHDLTLEQYIYRNKTKV